jgi:RNA polymerase sigma-70 factor (ECF subfamily)
VTDHELLDQLRHDGHDAFDAIFRQHYAGLVGLAQGVVRERAIAEELAQDVMLELWRRRHTLSVEESLRAYLYRATRNRALNHVRHERVQRHGEPYARGEESAGPSAHHRLAEDEIHDALQQAVQSLPERCRQVFELSRGRGLRHTEIAEEMGISVKTVEAQMGKALRVLRERLAPWLPGGADDVG